jgi:ABC-type Fe3+ transport system substrate-binding protein
MLQSLLPIALSLIVSMPALAVTEPELEELAKKEGKLHLATNGLGYGDLLLEEFRKRYPYLKVNHTVFEAAGPRYFFYGLMEAAKDEKRADVVLRCQDRDLLEWKDSGWLADLSDLPNWENRPRVLEDDKGYVYFLGAPHVVFWNPAKVKESDLPKSYDELLDPKWKGKVAVRSPLRGNSSAFFAHYIQDTRGNLDWFQKLGANKAFVGQSGFTTHLAVQNGKFPIGLSRDVELIGFARDLKKQGKKSKLMYKVMEGESPYQYQLALVNKTAPNSAAAKLFVNWLLKKETMALLEKAGYSVGERRAAQMQHKKVWEWKLSSVARMAMYESTISRAFRALVLGGATVEKEKPGDVRMAMAMAQACR